MIPIALILLAIVILFCVAIVVSNPVAVTLSIFGLQIPLQTPAVFFTGAATMLVTIVALWLLRVGVRRERARRKELKTLKKAAKADAKATPTSGATTASRPAVDTGSTTPQTAGGQQTSTTQTGSRLTTPQTSAPQTGTTQTGTGTRQAATPASDGPASTAADREALLAEVEDATRDDPPR